MSMANSSLLSIILCLLLLGHDSLAQRQSSRSQQQQQNECRVQNLNPLEPARRIQHEAGVSEEWDQNNDQLQCAGVAATRHLIEPRGLLLPSFNNAPMLVYVLQGQGLLGTMIPGCPETYQSFQQSQEGRTSQRSRDQHQKVRRIRQGDIIALPAGIAHWSYNDGNNQLVLVVVHDTNNNANQLDQRLRVRNQRNNGLEETICSMRLHENIANPERADVYSARGGRISTVNSHNLPILRHLQLSAERGNGDLRDSSLLMQITVNKEKARV